MPECHKYIERASSTVQPELEEESHDTDALIPSAMVTATVDHQDLQRRTRLLFIAEWARRNIGVSHRGKRKTYDMRSIRHNKRLNGKSVRSDGTIEDKNNTTYHESNDNSYITPNNDDNDEDDTGGGTASLTTQGGGYERPLSPFTADQLTYYT
jgi:hypothetical protein